MRSLLWGLNGAQKPGLWFSDIGQTPLLSPIGEWEWVDFGAAWAGDLESDVSWSVVDIDLDGNGKVEVYMN